MSVKKWCIKPATMVFIVAIVLADIFACLWITWFTDFSVANAYGLLALTLYGLSLMPSTGIVLLLTDLFPFNTKFFLDTLIQLRKYRRQLGVASFAFSLNHGTLILQQQLPNWSSDMSFYDISLKYWHGLVLMGIMSILTITSNNFSVKSLGKYWGVVHRLTYPMAFLILYHILDKMGLEWTFLTPICIALSVFILSLLIWRFCFNCICTDDITIAYCRKMMKLKSKQKSVQVGKIR